MAEKTVRTRFAPSPTGYMHVGGVRTALFAWLLARQGSGEFLLRFEDTDRQRHIGDAEKHIIESLEWLGLEWDNREIYRQSEKLSNYGEWAEKLIESGRAYVDITSEQERAEQRNNANQQKKVFQYKDHRPENSPAWTGHQLLRFKSEPRDCTWTDEVMGELSAPAETIDDFVLMKSDGFPTYDFAHIVDDHQMGITHVMRSQEFASSIPKYLNLYEALQIERPKLALLPYVLAPDGKKKLSKRDGAKDALQYKQEGYLPEAMINFLATLGWNDGTEQEIFSREELIEKFSLSRVQKSGAHFDEHRLLWLNGHYIRQLQLDELYKRSRGFWPKSAAGSPAEYQKKVLALVQERLKHLSELPSLTNFFFEDLPVDLKLIDGSKQLKGLGRGQQAGLLRTSLERLSQNDFTESNLSEALNKLLKETGQKPAVLFSLIRIATTWAPASPGLADTLALLGKEKSLKHIDTSLRALEE